MRKLIFPGRIFFAVGIMALGVLQFISGDFVVGRPPAYPADLPGKLVWAYVSGAVFIIAGIAVIGKRKAGFASLIIGAIILTYSFLLRHLPGLIGSPFDSILWSLNAYKSLALATGALIIAVSFFREENHDVRPFSNDTLILMGTIAMAFFLVICGCAHFKFNAFVKDFIPAYIPLHPFFTYFTAVALIAGGAGLVIKKTRKWAAALSGLMIFLWFILLHIPRFAAAPNDASDRMGLCESLAISGILFVMAGIFSEKDKKKQVV